MRRIAIAAAMVGIAIAVWLVTRHAPAPAPAPDRPSARTRLAELRHQEPASLAGTVTAAGAPIATATVCARDLDDGAAPRCAPTDAAGAWELAALPPGSYTIWASAPELGGAAWQGPPPDLAPSLALAAGEHREGLALVLVPGAVAVRGHVHDVRGAPIAAATIELRRAHAGPLFFTRTAADGAFTAWATPGELVVSVSADGFVDSDTAALAPADDLAIELTPAGVLTGTVIDAATRAPIDDAQVEAQGERARTDAAGHFAIGKLPAGRYKPTATSIGGYGEAAQSVLVGLGQKVDGVVIEIHPVAVVAGRVVIDAPGRATPCPPDRGHVWLNRYGGSAIYSARTLDDGQILLEGVVPGSYHVEVSCEHAVAQVPYPELVVRDSDVEDLIWSVVPGAGIGGHVRARGGEPIAGARVRVRSADNVSFASVLSGADGAFTADGVRAGAVQVEASADNFLSGSDVDAIAGRDTNVEVVLDRGGAIAGTVVDGHAQPAAGAKVIATAVAPSTADGGGDQADRRGGFRVEPLAPGTYKLTTETEWDDVDPRGVEVVVALGHTADVQLTAAAPSGAIDGEVVSTTGASIADAYVVVARETESSWGQNFSWKSKPVLAGLDGRFRVKGLPDGKLAVRAYRPGGSEAVITHVSAGDHVTIQLRPTGVLAGVITAASGAVVTDAVVRAEDRAQDLSREERVYYTGGRFVLGEMPAGHYKLTVDSDPNSAVEVDLADGGRVDDVHVVLQPRYTVHGRLVSAAGAPLAGWKVEVPRVERVEHGSGGRYLETATVEVTATSRDGTFAVHDLPAGATTLEASDVSHPSAHPEIHRDLDLSGAAPVIELGDLRAP